MIEEGDPRGAFAAEVERHGELGDEERSAISALSASQDPENEVPEEFRSSAGAAPVERETDDIRTRLSKMSLPERLKTAMFGNGVARALLIRDPNRLISLAVLKNPKLQSSEVEDYGKNPNLSEHVLRAIASSQEWMKSYSLKFSVVTNPKTPQDVALKWLRYLNQPELKRLARSKSIPQLVAVTAKKRLADMDKR